MVYCFTVLYCYTVVYYYDLPTFKPLSAGKKCCIGTQRSIVSQCYIVTMQRSTGQYGQMVEWIAITNPVTLSKFVDDFFFSQVSQCDQLGRFIGLWATF